MRQPAPAQNQPPAAAQSLSLEQLEAVSGGFGLTAALAIAAIQAAEQQRRQCVCRPEDGVRRGLDANAAPILE